MKTLVVSDLHLTSKFDQKKFNFLYKLFNQYDSIIINGDFWSIYSNTFDEFLKSKWNKLFKLMLNKKTIYIYGNHDQKQFIDDRASLFSTEQAYFKEFDSGEIKFRIEHGHLHLRHKSNSNQYFLKLNRYLKIDERVRHPLDKILYKYMMRNNVREFLKKINKRLESKIKAIHHNKVVITGHTHIPEINLESGFVNTGFVGQGMAWYLEIENGKYDLKFSKY